jgi:hypothetical protein
MTKSPVRENRPPGSVRGAPGNRRPYRDPICFRHRSKFFSEKISEKALPKEAFGLNSLAMVEVLRSNVKKLAISFLHV